ncbi:hypothetical protein [Burkholderia phage vB_BpP_HN04]|nr:hypothetical protein [Burkholderia phage vB_BpP_HN01]
MEHEIFTAVMVGMALCVSGFCKHSTRVFVGFLIIGVAGMAYSTKSHAADWGNGLNCDSIANLSRAVMYQKEQGNDRYTLKQMTYYAAVGAGVTNLKLLTDAIVDSAFKLEGMTPNLFSAIMYNECVRANQDVRKHGEGML